MYLRIFLFVAAIHLIACGSGSSDEKTADLWVGSWCMTGYDNISVENRDTLVFMNIDENGNIEYITKTRSGDIIMQNKGSYSMNDQKSMITVEEDGVGKIEYFIRKVDQDSFIFQSDTFIIKWKRID